MRRILLVFLALGLAMNISLAQKKKDSKSASKEPALIIARLPIQENFTTVFEMVYASSAQVKKYELKHAGTEKITVPAGTFETVKILISQIDGGEKFIYWLSASDKNMIKIEAIVPQMGNAKMTAELK